MAARDDRGRFVPGESGNPGGRPRGIARGELRGLLDAIEADGETMGETALRSALRRVIRIAVEGSDRDALAATKWIVEQIDGRLPVPVDAHADLAEGLTIVFAEAQPPEPEDAA